MTTEKTASEKNRVQVTNAPPLPEDEDVKAGAGQTVVTSPAGTRSVVEDDAVPFLKVQGYKVG